MTLGYLCRMFLAVITRNLIEQWLARYTCGMFEFRNGSMHLFKVFGIRVFLHWSWFALAFIVIYYDMLGMPPVWALLTYIGLFGIVLLHEFGHALACRSVGGEARTIMLWPLGGIAFVNPPPRPGPVLWSIAAGPLVNVVLMPILGVIWLFTAGGTDFNALTGPQQFITALAAINLSLLVFNLLPIYPLDGGQILQALLWFFIGRAKSLRVVSVIGLIGAAVGAVFCILTRETWLFIIALFVGWQAFNGYRMANMLAKHENAMPQDIQSPR